MESLALQLRPEIEAAATWQARFRLFLSLVICEHGVKLRSLMESLALQPRPEIGAAATWQARFWLFLSLVICGRISSYGIQSQQDCAYQPRVVTQSGTTLG
jgi:hypothetical protein